MMHWVCKHTRKCIIAATCNLLAAAASDIAHGSWSSTAVDHSHSRHGYKSFQPMRGWFQYDFMYSPTNTQVTSHFAVYVVHYYCYVAATGNAAAGIHSSLLHAIN
jgi:hypothetical protein